MAKKKKIKKGINVKKTITFSLTLFLVISAFAFIIKEAGGKGRSDTGLSSNSTGTKVMAYYFHGTRRCWSCNTIEEYTVGALGEYFSGEIKKGKLEFVSVNLDEPENRLYIERYRISSKTLVVVLVVNGKDIKYESLNRVWQLVRNKESFYQYVKENVGRYIDELSSYAGY